MARSINVEDDEVRPVLGPAGNKARSAGMARKPALKPVRKVERAEVGAAEEKKASPRAANSPPLTPPFSASSVLRRHELLIRSNLSLNASCSSDASTDSFCSRASTGRIGRPSLTSRRRQSIPKPEKIAVKMEKIVPDGFSLPSPELVQGKRRCAWVTANTGQPGYGQANPSFRQCLCYSIHPFSALNNFNCLILVMLPSMMKNGEYQCMMISALAELTWPVILSKRHIFREVFMDFDPVLVSKLNEKKLIAPGSTASSLLSEPKLRAVIENARQILKIIEEFGSFDRYCWSFVNHKPIMSRFRYPRQVPVKTPKADVISKDLVRRGFRSVGPSVIYSFMQASGITNDHLISCYRFRECVTAATSVDGDEGNAIRANHKVEEITMKAGDKVGNMDLSGAVDGLSIS
ncbi:hypothetical protein COCNU_11G012060 [Cocos nucifera]|uniref:DNA glycosylase superfamily protein n=1 Tax=Cocos nucifera TaxID=13894 RepID=A0A8K0IRR9_COCNU|nr:hypothetical protein COCNU_11G012060 [Cocos nucifera]